jgi:propionyl-CoA carboxylase alpha chain
MVPSGWRNTPSVPQETRFEAASGEELAVRYSLDRDGGLIGLEVEGEALEDTRLISCSPTEVRLEVGGVSRAFTVRGGAVNCDLGQVELRPLPRLPEPELEGPAGSLLAPTPGAVIRVLAEAGAAVESGQPILVLEAMKMEHEVTAPTAGVISELRVGEGDQVEAGEVLAVIGDAS